MTNRRGRPNGPALVALAVVGTAAAVGALAFANGLSASAPVTPAWDLVARDANGATVLRVPLPDGRFTLRYRNSVYGSVAEERFAVDASGNIRLVELAADEAAVLGEYYVEIEAPEPAPPGDPRRWRAAARPTSPLAQLPIAATAHGERSLVVTGRSPIGLWLLVPGANPSLVLHAEEAG